MEETKFPKAKIHWKQRRSRSTSNLVGASSGSVLKSDSDDTGKEGNDSDDAQRSFARLSIQTGRPRAGPRTLRNKALTLTTPNVESDSVNELLALPHLKTSQSCRRRRRYKRMAIDYSETTEDTQVFKEPHQAYAATILNFNPTNPNETPIDPSPITSHPMPSTSAGIHHHPHSKKSRKKLSLLSFELESGKRKRSGRDKSADPFPLASCSVEFQNMIGMGMDLMNVDSMENEDELMKEDDDVSSLSSGSESIPPSCDEGREGDDEQSDWVGDEWKDDLGEAERRELIFRRLRDYVPSREIRAGKRRVHPEIPPFSIRTYANERVSKFLQDPAQSQLRLHPMKLEERVQLSHIASLYSLHLQSDESAGGCPVLTKTINTTQVNDTGGKLAHKAIPTDSHGIIMESESDSKRIKSDNLP